MGIARSFGATFQAADEQLLSSEKCVGQTAMARIKLSIVACVFLSGPFWAFLRVLVGHVEGV